MSGQDAGERVVDLAALRACMERALEADGMSPEHAAETAEVLLDAELRGYDDHGVWFMGEVHKWLRVRRLEPRPEHHGGPRDGRPRCCWTATAAAAWRPRTRRCAGAWSAPAERGIATAGIQRSGHFIAAAPFPTWAAKQGYIAMAAANVVPLMPAPGGRSKSLGTNPFCFAAPTGLESSAGLRHGDERHRRLQGPDHGPAGQVGRGRAGLRRRRAARRRTLATWTGAGRWRRSAGTRGSGWR